MSKDSPEVLQRVHEGLSLVPDIARRLRATMGPRAELDELMSCGRAAVLDAARGYDPERGHSFRIHAKNHLERAMLDGFRKMAPLPRRAHEKLTADDLGPRGQATAQELERERLREKHMAGVATAQAEGLLAQLGLDTAGDFLAVSPKTMPDIASQRNEERALLEASIAALPPDEASVIRHYLQGVPIERISKQLGISRVTAQSLYDRAVQRLQKRLAKRR